MKGVFHKSLSVFMAVVVLITTMSFTLDMHYCGDTMVDYAFFKDAKVCGMERMQTSSVNKNQSFSQKSCCSDKQLFIQGQDNLHTISSTLTFEQQFFFTAFLHSYARIFEGTTTTVLSYIDEDFPFILQDILVLHQTFLI